MPTSDVARADLVLVEGVRTRAVDGRRVVVLADGHQRHEARAGIRQRDRHRSGIEIENRRRIERIAVEPDHRLVIDRGRLAAMVTASRARRPPWRGCRYRIGLGADEVVDGDRHGATGRRLRPSLRDRSEGQSQGDDRELGRHGCLPFEFGSPRCSGGAFHFPLSACASGQYRRITEKNDPFGAGSQLDSRSLPGDSFWT